MDKKFWGDLKHGHRQLKICVSGAAETGHCGIDALEKAKELGREIARQGAGFVAVYCPTEELKKKAWRILEPQSPIVARHYAFTGIEHLKGEV